MACSKLYSGCCDMFILDIGNTKLTLLEYRKKVKHLNLCNNNTHFCCLADSPEPLLEPSDDFLQLATILAAIAKGSPYSLPISGIGGGCSGGGGRKSIQFVAATN